MTASYPIAAALVAQPRAARTIEKLLDEAAGEGHRPDLDALRFRAESLRKVREFFRERGVLEIETPRRAQTTVFSEDPVDQARPGTGEVGGGVYRDHPLGTQLRQPIGAQQLRQLLVSARDLARQPALRDLGPDLLADDFDAADAVRRIQERGDAAFADALRRRMTM